MVIKRYVRRIAFVVLMLTIVSFAVEALSISTTSPSTPVSDTVGASRTFSITIDENANFTWYINESVVQSLNENSTTSSYANTSAASGYWNISVDAVAVNGTGTLSYTWWWTVTASNSAPSVTVVYPNGGEIVNGTISLNASASDSDGTISNVTFYYSIDGSSWTTIGVGTLSGSYYTRNWNTASVSNGANYSVKAKAFDNLGASSEDVSNAVFNISNDVTPPGQVTNLRASAIGQTYINWTWSDPSDADLNHIEVTFGSFTNITVAKGVQYYNTSSNTTLSSGTSYTIYVYTFDNDGNSNVTSNSNTTLPNTVSDGQVSLGSNVVVNFSGVTSSGNTSMTVSSSNTWGVSHDSIFTAVGNYYNITSTATFGSAIVEIPYTPPTGVDETVVKLYHLESGVWREVTSGRNASTDKVYGNVTSFSPFVPGVPPGPGVISKTPDSATVQTVGSTPQNFTVAFNQTVNVSWYVNGTTVATNTSVTSHYYLNSTPLTGTWNVTVVGNNTNGTASYTWLWTVRPRTYETGNRIWDASKEMSTTYTWNPMSFYAFYYDLDNNVGNESLKVILESRTDRSVQENTLIYSTAPENVSFKYKSWGYYNVVGFMAEKFFAGYTSATSSTITSSPKSAIGTKQLHKILTDDDTRRAVYAGSTLTLSEGYVLKIRDVDITGGKIVLLSLLKDGNEVDTTAVTAGGTYVYSKKVGSLSELPVIAVHIDTVFAGKEANAAFMKGIFQISESFTSVNQGNRYGIMEITAASDSGITMVNKNSLQLSPGSINDVMGDIKMIVADNSSVLRFAPMVKKTGTYEVRGTISQHNDTSFDWNPLNFEGFYYDINEDVGSEKLSITRSDRSIGADKLVYTTTPQSVSFKYKNFGSYSVIGFMAGKYFAGYTTGSNLTNNVAKSTINSKQLHKILLDDDTQRAVYAGSTLTLNDGYVLKVKDVDITGGKIVLLQLLKDGNEVDTAAIQAGNVYVYSKRVGSVSDLPVIAVNIATVFAGKEANAAFVKGVFQIAESYTSVNAGDTFGIMKVTEVSDTKIEMKNPSSFSLSTANVIDVMGNIKFKVADSSDIRFYPFIMVNGSVAAANQLVIDAPSNPMVRDTITITITAGGSAVPGAAVSFDNTEIGITNSTGNLNYTLTRSGVHNITATKLGYEKAIKTIQVAEFVENRLSIEVPAVIDQGFPVSIKVVANGTAIAGAAVTFDNTAIGTTDINGILNYTFTVSGTHNLGASKEKYISVVREINIRMPFSEYRALDISITPNVVFTDEDTVIRSNITNAGTKADDKPVELVLNGTVVENKTVALAPGEIKEINFTRKEALPGNYTVEILGQKGLLQVQEEPLNLLLIGGIATGFGAIIIYLLTSKSKISLEAVRRLLGKFGKKGVEKVIPPGEGKV